VTEVEVLDIMRGAFGVAAKIAGPILLSALVLGVVISLVQTVTQIQEMTLSFIPKIIVTAVVLVVAGPWMLDQMLSYTREIEISRV